MKSVIELKEFFTDNKLLRIQLKNWDLWRSPLVQLLGGQV